MNAPAPTEEAQRAADEITLDSLSETLELAAWYARAAAECAWRGEGALLRLRLIQTSRATTEALQTFAALQMGHAL